MLLFQQHNILSGIEFIFTEKIRLKNREGVLPTPIEETTSSSDVDVADEKQFFFTQADGGDETEEQILDWKQQFRKKGTE